MSTRGQILYEFVRGEFASYLPLARVLEITMDKAAFSECVYDGRFINADTSRMIDKEMERNVDKFWMCLTGKGGEPVVRHTSQEAAIHEAKRLTKEYKYDTYVLEVVDVIHPRAAPTISEIMSHANTCGWVHNNSEGEPIRYGLWRVCRKGVGLLPELVALGVNYGKVLLRGAGGSSGPVVSLECVYTNAEWFKVEPDGSDFCDIPF